MGRPWMRAGNIGIEPFHSMDESIVQQKSQGTIDNRRFGPQAFAPEAFQHIIGTDSTVTFQQDTQRTTPHLGKPQLVESAVGISLLERPCDAPFVVVPGKPDDGLRDVLLHV